MMNAQLEFRKFLSYPIEFVLGIVVFLLLMESSINLGFYQGLKIFYVIILATLPILNYFLSPVKRIVPQIVVAAFLFLALLFFLNSFAFPVQAQFLQGGQTWMEAQFGEAGDVIALAFNVLRGLFVIYLGISLVKVINAAREDEDWKSLARTPLIILIAITMGDILVNLIVGA